MKTCLITGVAGFIGSALAKRLLDEGYRVVGIDNFLTGLVENIPPGVIFLEIDITDSAQLEKLDSYDFDVVLHLAAQTSGEISFDDPEKDLQINALGTLYVAQYCSNRNIPRLLYASSATVYGDAETQPILVSQCKQPKSYYGITKLAGEQYLRLFSEKINITTLRMFNVYGPGQNIDNIKQGMVSIYLYYLMKGEPILVKGSKDRFRDFIYIDDVVDAWVAAVEGSETYGGVYNLSSGSKTTVADLLLVLCEAWGEPQHAIAYTDGTPGDTLGSVGSIEKTKNDLNWSPKVDLKDGVNRTVNWVKNK